MSDAILDIWAAWVLDRRFNGDLELQRQAMAYLGGIRDKIMDNVGLTGDDVVLDVGAGDGLIAFGVLGCSDNRSRVIFNDISMDLLDHCRAIAESMGVMDRCTFLHASAEDLSDLPSESVDVIMFRSVLIYVADKQRAFREFYRVLKPGGRLSCFEPINRFSHYHDPDCFWGYDVAAIRDLAARVRAVYERLQPFDTDPMLDFDERDLIDQAFRAGFSPVKVRLEMDASRDYRTTWDAFSQTQGNPRIPTLVEAIGQTLSEAEAKEFVQHLGARVENDTREGRSAVAYLWATKPKG
jgi:ubiquinone/menaquinone biosynthesis C-methylase UbiE